MIDIKLLRSNPELFKKDLEKRGSDFPLNELVQADKSWRLGLQELQKLQAMRNKTALEVAELKKKNQPIDAQKKQMSEVSDLMKKLEKEVAGLEQKVQSLLMRAPNPLHESVPVGADDTQNVEVRKWGTIPAPTFELKPHGELAQQLGLADFERATKIAGAGFYYLKGDLVLLDQALINYATDFLVNKNYEPIEPPLIMQRKPYEGVTALSDFENVMYKIDGEDSYLIATSEHPMAAMYMDETIPEKQLPIKLCGISPCFRREIGKHGVDTKGLFRTHQFNKIEQFVFCKPEDSWKLHEELLQNIETIFKNLGIPNRVVNVCTGDISTVAAKEYDLEAWSPRQKKYFEVGSCSNCTDYQARCLNIKCENAKGERRVLHTLNSTAIATGRAIAAILENYQQADGSVKIPDVLVPFMKGKKTITAPKE